MHHSSRRQNASSSVLTRLKTDTGCCHEFLARPQDRSWLYRHRHRSPYETVPERLSRLFDLRERIRIFDTAHVTKILAGVGRFDRPANDLARLCFGELVDEQHLTGAERFPEFFADLCAQFIA